MDYFRINKYKSPSENALYCAKRLYILLEKDMHIDELFLCYSKKNNIELSLNIERFLYLGLEVLFCLGKVTIKDDFISRNL